MKRTPLASIIIFVSTLAISEESSPSIGSNLGLPFSYQFTDGGPSKSPLVGISLGVEYINLSDKKSLGVMVWDIKTVELPFVFLNNYGNEGAYSCTNIGGRGEVAVI